MFAYCGWAILGLPIAYLLEKKYHRGWVTSILGGMSFVILGAFLIGFLIVLFKYLSQTS